MRRGNPVIFPLRIAVILLNLGWVLLGDRLSLKIQLLIPIFSVLLWGLSVYLRCNLLTREGRAKCVRSNLWLLLIYYLALISVILLFGGLFHVERNWGGMINLDLFHTVKNYWKLYLRTGNFESVSNLLGNIVVLMPLGILLPVMFRPMRKFWLALPVLLAVAIGVEFGQYVLQSGTADIDDSLFNFLGAWASYAVTRGVQMILKIK